MKEKVLVLGGSYFVGFQIVQYLIKDGFEVTTLNRGSKKDIHSGHVNEIYCDRHNPFDLKTKLANKKFDYVIDISGLNKDDVENSYEALKNSNLKSYIFISSSAVYKPSEVLPISENFLVGENPFWAEYGINKINAENFLFEKFKKNNFPVISLRPPYIYGEKNYVYRESYIFDQVKNNKTIVIPDKGQTLVQFIHIEDLYYTIKNLLNRADSLGEVYNVGNKTAITFKGWVQTCLKACNKKTDIYEFNYSLKNYTARDFFPFHDYQYYLDISKIEKIYSPKISLIDGLKRSYEWYQNNEDQVIKREHYLKNSTIILNS